MSTITGMKFSSMTTATCTTNIISIHMLKRRERSRIHTGIATRRFATSTRIIRICIIDMDIVETTRSADNDCFATARFRSDEGDTSPHLRRMRLN